MCLFYVKSARNVVQKRCTGAQVVSYSQQKLKSNPDAYVDCTQLEYQDLQQCSIRSQQFCSAYNDHHHCQSPYAHCQNLLSHDKRHCALLVSIQFFTCCINTKALDHQLHLTLFCVRSLMQLLYLQYNQCFFWHHMMIFCIILSSIPIRNMSVKFCC